jgi:hypothetical protein
MYTVGGLEAVVVSSTGPFFRFGFPPIFCLPLSLSLSLSLVTAVLTPVQSEINMAPSPAIHLHLSGSNVTLKILLAYTLAKLGKRGDEAMKRCDQALNASLLQFLGER